MNFYDKLFQKDYDYEQMIGLNQELKAIYLSNYLKFKKQSILVVTNSVYEATQLYQSVYTYEKEVRLFPMDDFLTSEAYAISPELKINRIETMIDALSSTPKIVITNMMGYLRFLPKKDLFKKSILNINVSQEVSMHELIEKLNSLGYERETIVTRTGEFAVRGFVLDIFPISSEYPVRIEFWGDQIESIRETDINSQRTMKNIKQIIIFPNTEFLANNIHNSNKKHRELKKYGIVESIYDYLDNPTVFYNNYTELKIDYEHLITDIVNYSKSINLPGNTEYMHDFNSITKKDIKYFENFEDINTESKSKKLFKTENIALSFENPKLLLKELNYYISKNKTVVLCLSNRYQANKLIDNFGENKFIITSSDKIYPQKINIVFFSINCGYGIDSLVVLSEKELFNKQESSRKYKSNFKLGSKIRDITKLEMGDYIVHRIHGIGQYAGLKTLEKNGLKKDYLMIKYKGNDKVYLPVEKIDFISKYSSNKGIKPTLTKLGGNEWKKTKQRIKEKIESIAEELIELYSKRDSEVGFSFDKDSEEQEIFESEFEYLLTDDQIKVLIEIKKDMESSKPMDRLLCGDVGFGKTEVAFRAVFKAIMSGKQAAILCPTTILSNQHYKNAKQRFQNFGVEIALINRFVTAKKLKEIKDGLLSGKIDFIIGTHRILSDDIVFKNLGFLVVDEEQRFGVKHKEKIKQIKSNIDVLTLSATPIPRTLQMSLSGVRKLSLIETPPKNRYPVQTYVMAKNETLLKDAIYKELSRDGQIFILYNDIESMESEKNRIQKLVPEAKIVMAHGRMSKNDLENVMLNFTDRKFDILICTTIIETGIDIPNVNTLIIEEADHFGLSQLYQIRGRVGRGSKIAYCYLMYNPKKVLSEIATKRLNVIKDFTELGSGFHIAMRDLSLRGAGDILGREQSGFIDSVGIELFMEMLKEEMDRKKGKEIRIKKSISQPLINVTTTIENNYVEEEELKIYIHKKINSINSYDDLYEVKAELEDRFGKLDNNILVYMYEEWFEKLAEKIGLTEVKQTKNRISLIFPTSVTEKVNGELLFTMTMNISLQFRFGMQGKRLVVHLELSKLEKHFIYYLIEFMEILEKAIIKKDK